MGDQTAVKRSVPKKGAARKAFDEGPWSKLTASQRSQLIWRIGDLIEQNADQLAQLETIDNGKPFAVAKAADVALAADMFRYMAGWATKIEGNTIPRNVPYVPGGNFHAYTPLPLSSTLRLVEDHRATIVRPGDYLVASAARFSINFCRRISRISM